MNGLKGSALGLPIFTLLPSSYTLTCQQAQTFCLGGG